jgi:intracellular septation protein
MKILFDFLPIIAFFIAYKWGGIYIATGVAMAASFLQVLWSRYQTGQFEKIPLTTFIVIMFLGSATLFLRNEMFIKLKPTAVYWVLALSFFGSQFFGNKKPLIQRLSEQAISMKTEVWHKLNMSWVIFFGCLGALNLYIAYNFHTDVWVNFKLFGTLICTIAFLIAQAIYMVKNRQPEANSK